MIKLEGISFRYPKAKEYALSNFSLEIPQGSFFALLGPNGAGKTTLLRMLCGRLAASAGSVKIAGELRLHDGDTQYSGTCDVLDLKRCGILLENPGVYPKLSIEEYLCYFAGFYGLGENACMPGGALRARTEELARQLDLPNLTMKMGALSLGNRQKVQIARAMLHSPKLLILDEPVANLDPKSRECVWRMIAEWRKKEGGTAIVCSHILAELETETTDFAIIDKGRVLKSGAVNDLVQNANALKVELPQNVSAEQVLEALSKAGLSNVQVSSVKSTLADLYRDAVQ